MTTPSESEFDDAPGPCALCDDDRGHAETIHCTGCGKRVCESHGSATLGLCIDCEEKQ